MGGDKKLLTITETAERLSLGVTKTYELVRTGELGHVRIGRALRVPTSELDSYVERIQTDGEPVGRTGVRTANDLL